MSKDVLTNKEQLYQSLWYLYSVTLCFRRLVQNYKPMLPLECTHQELSLEWSHFGFSSSISSELPTTTTIPVTQTYQKGFHLPELKDLLLEGSYFGFSIMHHGRPPVPNLKGYSSDQNHFSEINAKLAEETEFVTHFVQKCLETRENEQNVVLNESSEALGNRSEIVRILILAMTTADDGVGGSNSV